MAIRAYIAPIVLLYTASSIILTLIFLRLLHTLPAFNRIPPPARKRGSPTHLLIVLGSGGHTAEMLSLLHDLDTRSYTHRSYVISEGDAFSADKAREFEINLAVRNALKSRTEGKRTSSGGDEAKREGKEDWEGGSYSIRTVPRARRIHQSLLTAPFSCARCLIACLYLLITAPTPFSPSSSQSPPPSPPNIIPIPDLILLNGPATATILVFASLLLRFVGMRGTKGKMRTVYVESWARVRRLSLSGRILVGLGAVNRCLVQWEGVKGGLGVEYRGCLVK